jgi:hypothetical protein
MGYLLANVAFATDISSEMAHQLSKASEQLTYRQLFILKLAVVKQAFNLREGDYRGQISFEKELYRILYECIDLYYRGYISFEGTVGFGPPDVAPGKMTAQGLGADLYNQRQLSLTPDNDLLPIANQLK